MRNHTNSRSWKHLFATLFTLVTHDLFLKEEIINGSILLFLDTERHLLEPPVVGYQGHIPRMRPTNLPVGRNYRYAAETGLQNFYESRIK